MNRLQYETSPYLLQHASNPVDWYPWSDAAFSKAKRENKPVLVSIGYSTCHWCHVMEKESFEDEATARLMNDFFVNIKVDREERPDIDQIYMDAVQHLGVSGGWPLNVFLTPDKKPFYGGTYFPPRPAYNRPSWEQVLIHIHRIFEDKRKEVEMQAERLITAIQSGHNQFLGDPIGAEISGQSEKLSFENILNEVEKQFDTEYGGIGPAPKFPSTMMLHNLAIVGRNSPDSSIFQHFLFTLERMGTGGIYDQIGGGFSRYSVDRKWHVPHFEKMLYDNALLLSNYAMAHTLSGDPFYKRYIDQIIQFLNREMKSDEELYYAAYDADSEGIEGKFYVWDKFEIDALLGDNAELLAKYFQVSENGNWEGTNVLFPGKRPDIFASENNIPVDSFKEILEEANQTLYHHRQMRIPPALDDKIIVSWNALLIKGMVDSYIATPQVNILEGAIRLIKSLGTKSYQESENRLYHIANGQFAQKGFLDDYAFLIQSCIALHEVNADEQLLLLAERLTDGVLSRFLAKTDKIFYFTEEGSDVVVRKIELYDQALPSGNAVMAANLWHLGKIFGREEWIELSRTMMARMKDSVKKFPRAFPFWLNVWIMQEKLNAEIVVIGNRAKEVSLSLKQIGLSGLTWMTAQDEHEGFPLLTGRKKQSGTFIYICQDFQCQQPLESIEEAIEMIEVFYDFNL